MTGLCLGIFAGLILTFFLIPLIHTMLEDGGIVRSNYCGKQIPLGLGISFLAGSLFGAGILVFFKTISFEQGLLWMFALLAMGFLGLLDDLAGSRAESGLKGHFKKLLKEKRLSTGALKALGGGTVAFFLSLFSENGAIMLIPDTMMVALMTNAINLLDLRPGRAIKGYLFSFIVLLLFVQDKWNYNLFLLPLTLNVLLYLPFDLKAKSMMGDVGSNVLGIGLGVGALWFLPSVYRIILLILLIIFHLYTEKYSLSKKIEANKILRKIDEWGR